MNLIDFHSRTRLVFGPNTVDRLGQYAADWSARHVLLVTDPHIVEAGHAPRAREALESAGLEVTVFDRVRENPTTEDVDACLEVARSADIDTIVGLGGGSSLDVAKGCNFLLTNGGRMHDYWGVGKATKPMLPLIAVPTTAGTGSETQSFALIADAETHMKMACGDKKAAARVAVLDPTLTVTQSYLVTAATGIDALAHAVETAVTKKRNALSLLFSREAFRLVQTYLPKVLERPGDLEARGHMQLAASFSGTAIENSMLGAAHAASNPLTAHFGVVHGQAVGVMLPAVVRYNAVDADAARLYKALAIHARLVAPDVEPQAAVELLLERIEHLLDLTGLPQSLRELNIPRDTIGALAAESETQWTAQFNPRPIEADGFVELYESTYQPPMRNAECGIASTQPVRPLPIEADEETKAGNYFVSNYPPFDYWLPDESGELTEVLERPPALGTKLGLYVHIPFCRRRCHFCYFKVYTDKNAKAISRYVDAVSREMQMYAERPCIGGRKPHFVYFGGGTPSHLSERQLRQLTAALQAALPWDEAEEIAFECEPGTLNEKKLAAIRDMGVTRLSLGVENFNDHVLQTNNRPHLSKRAFDVYEWAKRIGFPQINIDLIAGMLDETEENWLANVEETIQLAPDCVTIYQMEIPLNTTIYRNMQKSGQLTAPVADWDTKRRWVKYAFGELEEAGYTVTSAYTVVKDPDTTKFVYRDSLWTGADMIATGVSSFGHINGVHYQNEKHFDPYIKTIESGNLPTNRTLRITREEAMIREFVLQMKLGRVNVGYFNEKFGTDVLERFADLLGKCREEGFLTIHDDQITLDRDALLQVDVLVREFFLPQHRDVRRVTRT